MVGPHHIFELIAGAVMRVLVQLYQLALVHYEQIYTKQFLSPIDPLCEGIKDTYF